MTLKFDSHKSQREVDCVIRALDKLYLFDNTLLYTKSMKLDYGDTNWVVKHYTC